MFFIKRLRPTHLLLISLLWCAASFVYAGLLFTRFEQSVRYFETSRLDIVLTEAKNVFQHETDKGTSLLKLAQGDAFLFKYIADDPTAETFFAVDIKTGRIGFSTRDSLKGSPFKTDFIKKCAGADNPFFERQAEKIIGGLSASDTSNNPVLCLVLEHKLDAVEKTRGKVVTAVVRHALFFSLTGICFFGLLFWAFFVIRFQQKPLKNAVKRTLKLFLCSSFLLLLLITDASLHSELNEGLKNVMTIKTKTVARVLKDTIQKGLSAGIPLNFLNGTQSALTTMKKNHPEIAFSLITDESGHVLYSEGPVTKAFKTDKKTGAVSLRAGFSNIAEPLSDGKKIHGWLQIGIKENYVRHLFF